MRPDERDGPEYCNELARRVSRRRDLHPRLRRALATALTAPSPLATVQDLATAVRRDRRTLYYHFGSCELADRGMTLKECVDWILLLRAMEEKRDHMWSWQGTATQLDLEVSRVSRISQRILGLTLSELACNGFEFLTVEFERRTGL